MSSTANEPPPKGWYPDPSGAPQWRIWNGSAWSEHVREFFTPAPPLTSTLEAVRATATLERGGAACLFGGVALLIDAAHHHSGLVARSADRYATVVLIGFALALFGHLAFARAGAAIAPRDRWLAVLPVVNVILWAGWACDRASYPLPLVNRPTTRAYSAAAGVRYVQSLSVAILVAYAWYPLPHAVAFVIALHLAPAVPACFDVHWARLLREDLAAAPVARVVAR